MVDAPSIGRLRWPVDLYHRDQAPADGDPGITETLVHMGQVHAEILDTGALTYYSGVQVDTPITNRVIIRWRVDVDTNCVIQRTQQLPDGTWQTLLYRVRRSKLWEGRTRFLELECELETIARD